MRFKTLQKKIKRYGRFQSIFIICLISSLYPGFAIGKPIVIGEKAQFTSSVLGEERELLIYKPNNYNTNKKYHVIYLLDGSDHFNSLFGIVEGLAGYRKIPESIIVGVSTKNRVRDFFPEIIGNPESRIQKLTENRFPEFGKADAFTKFLEKELIPHIDTHYSTLPHRTLVGHSNAGVYSLYSLFSGSKLFQNYLVISPAPWWSEAELGKLVATLSTENKEFANLFLSIGNEGKDFFARVSDLVNNLEMRKPKKLNWSFKHFPEESHGSVILPSLRYGLKMLFAELQFSALEDVAQNADISKVEKYYHLLSKKYGYEIKVPIDVFSDLADEQLQLGKSQEALETLHQFVNTHPKAPFAYMSLANALMKNQKYASAKKSFKKAKLLYQELGITGVEGYLDQMIEQAQSKLVE